MITEDIKIQPYEDFEYKQFVDMFYSYFLYDLEMEIEYSQIEEVCSDIVESAKKRVIFFDLLIIDGNPKGFIIYQIDSPERDWCQKIGFGFIREIFIEHDCRKKGFGKLLVSHAEEILKSMNVKEIYLTSDNEKFWIKCGYMKTDEKGYKNQEPIYIKRL